MNNIVKTAKKIAKIEKKIARLSTKATHIAFVERCELHLVLDALKLELTDLLNVTPSN
jgi:hypothetical protein